MNRSDNFLFFFQITEAYVGEAFNLLQKSIIRVEEDDVDIDDQMDDNDDEVMRNTEALNGMSLNETDNDNQHTMETSDQVGASQRITIQYDKFNEIKLMLAHRLRLNQQESEDGKDHDTLKKGIWGSFFIYLT